MGEDAEDPFADPDDGDDSTGALDDETDDPFADLEDDVDVDLDVDELFTEMDVDDIDEDEVWAAVVGEGETDSGTDPEGPDPAGPDAGGTAAAGTRSTVGREGTTADADGSAFGTGAEETVVRKGRYCQGCEYFAPPPDVACRHEGTEILELVDIDHYRVRNCPVVARRQGAAEDILPDEGE